MAELSRTWEETRAAEYHRLALAQGFRAHTSHVILRQAPRDGTELSIFPKDLPA